MSLNKKLVIGLFNDLCQTQEDANRIRREIEKALLANTAAAAERSRKTSLQAQEPAQAPAQEPAAPVTPVKGHAASHHAPPVTPVGGSVNFSSPSPRGMGLGVFRSPDLRLPRDDFEEASTKLSTRDRSKDVIHPNIFAKPLNK